MSDFLTLDEFIRHLDTMPWWEKKYYRLRGIVERNIVYGIPKLKDTYYHIRSRIEKGYSHRDVWGLHYYLTDVIVGSIRDLRKIYHGVDTEQFLDDLKDIADGFELQNKLIDECKAPTPEQEIAIDNAWNLLRYHWPRLWD